jgi:hypothetical protein
METKAYDEFCVKIAADNSIEATWTMLDGRSISPKPEPNVADKDLLGRIRTNLEKLKDGSLKGREEIAQLGADLYQALFPSRVGFLFEVAYAFVLDDRLKGDRGRWLRVIVEVDPKSEAFGWPLELLYCEEKSCWLASEQSTIALSRRISSVRLPDTSPVAAPLCVLVVISQPQGLTGKAPEKILTELSTLTGVQLATDDLMASPTMKVTVLGELASYQELAGIDYAKLPATLENLRVQLSRLTANGQQPHVVHFIGHSRYYHSKAELGLVDPETRQEDWTSADDFSSLLFKDWHPRLVLLQACEDAKPGTAEAMMIFADHLAQHDIQAVVATQLAMTNDYAVKFAEGFYDALLRAKDVDEAVQAGRYKIWNAVRRGAEGTFGAPVLFTYAPQAFIQFT